MDITAAASQAKSYERAGREIEAMVIDGSNKQAVMEMSNRHGLVKLVPADKTGKADFIELMNADFIMGRIRLSPACAALKDEYASLIWNQKPINGLVLKREEHPACENHAADSGLYGWRYCYQYLSRAPEKSPQPGTNEYEKMIKRKLFEHAQREVRGKKEYELGDFGVDMGGDSFGVDGSADAGLGWTGGE